MGPKRALSKRDVYQNETARPYPGGGGGARGIPGSPFKTEVLDRKVIPKSRFKEIMPGIETELAQEEKAKLFDPNLPKKIIKPTKQVWTKLGHYKILDFSGRPPIRAGCLPPAPGREHYFDLAMAKESERVKAYKLKTMDKRCTWNWEGLGDMMLEKMKGGSLKAFAERASEMSKGLKMANSALTEHRDTAEKERRVLEGEVIEDPTICKYDQREHVYRFGKCRKCGQGSGVVRGWGLKFGECRKGGRHVYQFGNCTKCGIKEGPLAGGHNELDPYQHVAKEEEVEICPPVSDWTNKRGPRMLFCHLCNTSHGIASLAIHQKECVKRWHYQMRTSLPRWPDVPIPVDQPGKEASMEDVDSYNDSAKEVYDETMPSCGRCGRSFDTRRKLEAHATYCYSQP